MARKQSSPPVPPAGGRRPAKLLAAGALLLAAVATGIVVRQFVAHQRAGDSAGRSTAAAAAIVEDEKTAFAGYAGSESCRVCHPREYELWVKSNHGLAERPVRPDMDRLAFEPPRSFRHGTQSTATRLHDGQYQVVTLGYSNQIAPYRVDRVIGNDPLRQFLTPQPGGRWQALEAAYDPRRNQWFNVYGAEDRRPGEWGHWTGRGMNWNSMCAACHNTRLRKNYDERTDTYHTTAAERSVGCEACHGPMKDHSRFRQAYADKKWKDPTIRPMPALQAQGTCGSCHSRRYELTGDFQPGDSYFDHYSLTIVDATETYYPDGQVHDEDYEFASFLSSRMRKSQIRCLDCHNPHSMKTILPGNALCLRCHNGSYTNAPKIDPLPHSFHSSTNAGSSCVGCHMPTTVYMQRHGRHDHGFTIPDPLLTQQLGLPNACNRCHADQSADWALQYCEQWYGTNMVRHTRQRARWIAAARQGETSGRDGLLSLLAGEDPPYWKAAAVTLLERWIAEPKVAQAVLDQLQSEHPLVREKAVRALDALVEADRADVAAAVSRSLADEVRSVRVAAAWTLRATVDPKSRAGRELQHALDLNADQPGGQMQRGAYCLARQELSPALEHFQKAVAWDPNSAPLRHELAVVLSMLDRNAEALRQIQEACRLDPKDAEYQYKLGLAWAEVGQLDQSVPALQRAVKLDPRHARAWYNLGLAQNSLGRPAEALESLARGESADPNDARIPYARATILAQLGRISDARAAARRALEIQPDFAPAAELLRSLE